MKREQVASVFRAPKGDEYCTVNIRSTRFKYKSKTSRKGLRRDNKYFEKRYKELIEDAEKVPELYEYKTIGRKEKISKRTHAAVEVFRKVRGRVKLTGYAVYSVWHRGRRINSRKLRSGGEIG